MDPSDDPRNSLVECPRCRELVVTVEMRTEGSVFWRCVRCGHIFARRLDPADSPPDKARDQP